MWRRAKVENKKVLGKEKDYCLRLNWKRLSKNKGKVNQEKSIKFYAF